MLRLLANTVILSIQVGAIRTCMKRYDFTRNDIIFGNNIIDYQNRFEFRLLAALHTYVMKFGYFTTECVTMLISQRAFLLLHQMEIGKSFCFL